MKLGIFLVLSMLLFGCTQAGLVSFDLGKEFAVKENSTYFNQESGIRIIVNSFNDSRCPADVQCIWEGELGVTLNVAFSVDGSTPSGKFTEVILGESTRPKVDIGNYTIELKSIAVDSAVIVVKQKNPNEKIFALKEILTVHEGEIYSDNAGIKFLVGSFFNSRCEEGMTCVWEGELGINIIPEDGTTLNNPEFSIKLSEKTNPRSAFGDYVFELVSIDLDKKEAKIVIWNPHPALRVSVADVVANPEHYVTELALIGSIGVQGCTKIACQSDVACCNQCFATITDLNDETKSLSVTGFDCAFATNTGNIFKGALSTVDGINYVFELTKPGESWWDNNRDCGAEPGNPGEGCGPITEKTEWFAVSPVQCGGNAWEQWREETGWGNTYAQGGQAIGDTFDEAVIVKWLEEEHGIIVSDIQSRQKSEIVCAACSCPRGDEIAVLVASSNAEKLIELGFARMEQIFCTKEALLCPDGSAVGREAPFCEFQKCPAQTPLTPFLVKTNVPGFTLPEFAIYVGTSIYADGRVTIGSSSRRAEIEDFYLQELRISKTDVDELIGFIETTNFFEEGEIRQCVADAPSKNLKISLNGKENELIGIGLECPGEVSEEVREIISRVETLVPAGTINPGFLQVSEVVENPQSYLDEENIQVQGIVSEPVACTLKFCSEEDPCCNSCSGTIHDIEQPELTLNVSGNDCSMNFENENVVIFGSLVSTEAGYVLNSN